LLFHNYLWPPLAVPRGICNLTGPRMMISSLTLFHDYIIEPSSGSVVQPHGTQSNYSAIP